MTIIIQNKGATWRISCDLVRERARSANLDKSASGQDSLRATQATIQGPWMNSEMIIQISECVQNLYTMCQPLRIEWWVSEIHGSKVNYHEKWLWLCNMILGRGEGDWSCCLTFSRRLWTLEESWAYRRKMSGPTAGMLGRYTSTATTAPPQKTPLHELGNYVSSFRHFTSILTVNTSTKLSTWMTSQSFAVNNLHNSTW